MIWSSNNKWGSKLRQKQAPQNRSTPRLLPPTWASAAESPGPKHQGQESPQGSPSLPLGLPKGPEHGATARQWPCEPSAPQRVNLQMVTHPAKRKRESEKDAGGDEADEGVDQGQDLTNEPTFEGAPSASGLQASPSPITTTLPIPDPAAATSTPITNPPMAEGTGFTGMCPYPAYGMGPPTTAFLEATTASEPVASSSAPRWYAADYHHPLPTTGTYVDVPGYATLSGCFARRHILSPVKTV